MPANGDGFDSRMIAGVIRHYNAAPQPELLGLSPDQVAQLLDGDWRTTGAVRINQRLPRERVNTMWAWRAALDLLRLVRDEGPAPVTATGNLTRKFVARALEAVKFPPEYVGDIRRFSRVLNEPDVPRLLYLRQTLVGAGWLRRHRGFRVTSRGLALLESGQDEPGPDLARLFLARMGVTGGFLDNEGRVFRSPLGPALFLLSRRAATWVDSLDLTDRLLIPSLLPEESPGQLGLLAYQWVLRPCLEFGLAERKGGPNVLDPERVRITSSFPELVRFHFVDGDGRPDLRLVR